MNEWLLYAICALTGYLIGSLETAIFVSKVNLKDDVRRHGSGNAGTTNMLRVYGKRAGAFTFIGDFIKGIIAILLGRWIGGEIGGYILGVFAVIGHDFPVFFEFKGGKGVATTFGIAWIIHPLFAAIITVVGTIIMLATQTVSLGSLIGITLFLILILAFHLSETMLVAVVIILWVLIIVRHTDNIRRLIKGEENKLFKRK